LSQDSYKTIESYIVNNDVKGLSSLNGLGVKTSQKIILELKDKIVVEDTYDNTLLRDAVYALEQFGFETRKIEKAVKEIMKSENNLEKIIKESLKILK